MHYEGLDSVFSITSRFVKVTLLDYHICFYPITLLESVDHTIKN